VDVFAPQTHPHHNLFFRLLALSWYIITRKFLLFVRQKGGCVMVSAIVLINTQRGEVNETAQRLLDIAGVTEVYSVTGEYDLVALVRVQQYDDLADIVTRRMQSIPSITKTHTLMAFQCYSRADLQQAWDIGLE
jgi:DNA-binding Lrp family transcriptional regulator